MDNNIINFSNEELTSGDNSFNLELSRLDTPIHNYDDTIRCYGIPIKRYFLPLIAVSGILALEELHTYVYMPIVIFLCSLILFWNFPEIIIFMNSRPIYYEELFLVNANPNVVEISKDVRNKFEYIFDYSLLFTNALLTAGLADYWLYQSWNTDSYIQIIGITGGILKIFQSINYITGGIILYFVRFMIEQELLEESDADPGINVEMSTFTDNLDTSQTSDTSDITNISDTSNNILVDTNSVNNSNIIFSMPTSYHEKDDVIIIHSTDNNNNYSIDDKSSKNIIFVHMPP